MTSVRGHGPSRKPNCRLSHVSCARRHLPSSSHQAAANCGPRRLSGSSAENTCATVPLGQISRRREDCQLGRSWRVPHAQKPGDALHHHLARVGPGLADERDAPDRRLREVDMPHGEAMHPLRAGARLARAAATHEEPVSPARAGVRRQLLATGMTEVPEAYERSDHAFRQAVQKLRKFPVLRAVDQAVEQAHAGVRRYRQAARRRRVRRRSLHCGSVPRRCAAHRACA